MGTQVFDLYADLQYQSAPTSHTFHSSDTSIPIEDCDATYKYAKVDSPCFDAATVNGVVTICPSSGVPVEDQLADINGQAAPCDASDGTMPQVASHRLDMTSTYTSSSVAVEHNRCMTNSAETVLYSLGSVDESTPVSPSTNSHDTVAPLRNNGSVTRIRTHVPSLTSFTVPTESCISDL